MQEYLAAPRWKRLGYRLARNSFMLVVIASFFLFVIKYRRTSKKTRWSSHAMSDSAISFATLPLDEPPAAVP